MVTGWLKRASGWYYLEPGNGNMVTGWRKIGGTWYYLNPGNGDMAQGWKKIGNVWYYLEPGNGGMATGWTTIGGTRYYMNQDGAMVEGLVTAKWNLVLPETGQRKHRDRMVKTGCNLVLSGE